MMKKDDLNQKLDKLVDYYHKNTHKTFRYATGIFLVIVFIYLILMLIPDNFKNGIGNKYLVTKNNEVSEEYAQKAIIIKFKIQQIPEKTSEANTLKYANDIVQYIEKQNNQAVYGIALDYLHDMCSKNMNKNDKLVYDKIDAYFKDEQVLAKLDGVNTVKHDDLQSCKPFVAATEFDNKMNSLEKERAEILVLFKNIEKERQFKKEAYGDAYDEKTGTYTMLNKSAQLIEEEKVDKRREERLRKRLKEIEEKILKEEKRNGKNTNQTINQ